MTAAAIPSADWLPRALIDQPGDAGDVRLLEALLAAVDAQRALLEADVDQVLDDVFIESCADWAVPYIGALVGLPSDAGRLEVAYAVALRKRKGTPLALEDLARAVTGWTALSLEGREVTVWAQYLGHPAGVRPASLDLRDLRRQPALDTPFDRSRRSSTPGRRWSPRAAAAVVWPWTLRTYRWSRARPLAKRRYALHPLGLDAPLYVLPRVRELASDAASGALVQRTASPADAPVRATYRVFEELAAPGEIAYGGPWQLAADHPLAPPADPSAPPPLLRLLAGNKPVPWSAIRFTEITTTTPAPPAHVVFVDPLRGHVQLGSAFERGVRAVWHRPVSGLIGSLAATPRPDENAQIVITVDPDRPAHGRLVRRLADAVALARQIAAQEGLEPSVPGRPDVEIRLETSESIPTGGPYDDAGGIRRWRIVAPTLSTPTLREALHLDLEAAEVALEGITLAGDLVLGRHLAAVTLDGVTMNPAAGRTLTVDRDAWLLRLAARRSILAPIRADLAASPIELTDCVVDGAGVALAACGSGAAPGSPRDAVAAAARFAPALSADGCTFAGLVSVEALDALDCIFVNGVAVADDTDGGLRHCFVAPGGGAQPPACDCVSSPPPAFASIAFESGGYYALELDPWQPLLAAASDGGEVGAYHHARRAASLARLRSRISDFVPLGLRSEVVPAPWEER